MQPIQETLEFRTAFTSTSQNNAQVVLFNLDTYASQFDTYASSYLIGHRYVLENFQVTCSLTNTLAVAPLPAVSPIMSTSEANAVISQVLSNYPKLSLDIFTANSRDSLGYLRKSECWLQNPGSTFFYNLMYPYTSLGDIRLLDRKNSFAVAIRDLGYGLLKGSDYLTVEAAVSTQITFEAL
jgi:hypothetical protein